MATTPFNFLTSIEKTLENTKLILENQGKILVNQSIMESKMAEDFTAEMQALADLKAQVATSVAEMDTLFADLEAALAGGPGNQPAIDAATMAIRAEIDNLKAASAHDMPPAPPAPPPGP